MHVKDDRWKTGYVSLMKRWTLCESVMLIGDKLISIVVN